MKPSTIITRTVLLSALSLIASVATLAQTPPLGVQSKYDRFADRTIYKVTISLPPERNGFILLNVFESFKGSGPKLPKPAAVLISIEAVSDEWYFLQTRTTNILRLIVDGKRYELGNMSLTHTSVEGTGVLEQLAIAVPIKNIELLASAKKVEMQIGRYEAEIKREQLDQFKAWLSGFE